MIVFIPGMMCDARLFALQRQALQDINSTVADISAHDNVQQLAAQILNSTPARFDVCGLSMGGIVAMEMIRQQPKRIRRLCLMDTNALAELPAVQARRQPQIDKVKQGKLAEVMREEIKPNYLYHGTNKQITLDLCMRMAEDLGEAVFERQSIALKNRPDQLNTLRNFPGKTLILHGEDDQLCPAERHQLIHQVMPNSHYLIIPQAGHLPTLENPQAVNTQLRYWLQSTSKNL